MTAPQREQQPGVAAPKLHSPLVSAGRLRVPLQFEVNVTKFPLGVGEAVGAFGRAAFARARPDALDLDSWGRTHLGGAAVDYLLTPFVRGIYGVQPAELGVDAAFPMLSVPPGQIEERLGGRFRRGVRVEEVPDAPNVLIATPAYAASRLLQ